jgi:hypothetical protein
MACALRCRHGDAAPTNKWHEPAGKSAAERSSSGRSSGSRAEQLGELTRTLAASEGFASSSSSSSSPVSVSAVSASAPVTYHSLLQRVTVVVVADVGSAASLRAAHCTWLATLDPKQVVHVTDFDLASGDVSGSGGGSSGGSSSGGGLVGGCGFPVLTTVKVKFAIDYYDVLHQLYVAKVRW